MSLISAKNLGIRYSLYRARTRSLKRTILQFLSRELERTQFWALRHVTLDLCEGDTLGVVGVNGAGKSTLCMALAQILEPDEGEVVVRGRVAPILRLGAGFNKDMTCRENIYLSGALMGYEPHEIREMQDDIVSFAELGDFVHNPVRTYSTGMQARLAFAIATSVDPDVLIVDETLSVGDAAFRKKSEARMRELMDRARAIVVVSHSGQTIRTLCSTALWLHKGEVRALGPTEDVVPQYEEWQERRVAARKRQE
ncbi:MAG: ABC transporter ATP-binding protein [Planctomycetota bacterium]|jgi:ABC-type polysaccharide/polyol phosphate transport system ATPase subunit